MHRARRTVARCHARVGDTRRDWLHKLSTTVVRENQLIAVEDLAVSGLARTRLALVNRIDCARSRFDRNRGAPSRRPFRVPRMEAKKFR